MPNNNNTIYSDFADYYDLYAEEYDYDLWFAYLKNLSGLTEFKGKRILDLGCGTGILLLKFAQVGSVVTGVDLSNKMLSVADQTIFEAGKKATLIQSDISTYSAYDRYDFIYSTCDTVNYLNQSHLLSMFANISKMMKNGSYFTFDMLNFNYFETISGKDVYNIQGIEYIFDRQIMQDTLVTEVRIKDGSRIKTENHIQYFFLPELIINAAKSQNLSVKGIWDIYTKMPPDKDSDKLQILLQKN